MKPTETALYRELTQSVSPNGRKSTAQTRLAMRQYRALMKLASWLSRSWPGPVSPFSIDVALHSCRKLKLIGERR